LVVDAALVRSRSQIRGQMVFDVDHLGHVLYPMADPLVVKAASVLAIILNGAILIFRRRAFDHVEVELALILGLRNVPLLQRILRADLLLAGAIIVLR